MSDPTDHKWITKVSEDTHTMGIKISANPAFASSVTGRLTPYKNFPVTLRPALEKVADYVRMEMIPRTFREEGPGWRKLSKRTQRERAAQGYNPKHPILYRSGDLFKELTDKGHPKHVEFIKTGVNSRIVISGSSEKFFRNQGGNQIFRIPPRPMFPGTGGIPLPDRDRKNINDILRAGIIQSVQTRGAAGGSH